MRANQEIQRFAYIVTHDLRAPLVNIMGFTAELDASLKSLQAYVLNDGKTVSEDQIHEARLAAAEDLPEAIGFIRSSTKKMDGLINAILKISRDGRRQLKPEIVKLQPMLSRPSPNSVYHQISESDGSIKLEIKAPRLTPTACRSNKSLVTFSIMLSNINIRIGPWPLLSEPRPKGDTWFGSRWRTTAVALQNTITNAFSNSFAVPANRTSPAKELVLPCSLPCAEPWGGDNRSVPFRGRIDLRTATAI